MKERTLRVLEFTKIRERLASKALTPMGVERCMALTPSDNLPEIEMWQAETEEAAVILQYLGASPLVAFDDVRPSISLAEKGATLSPKALLTVASLLAAARSARSALDTERENTPLLKSKAQALVSLRHIEDDITNAIISEEEIADRASTELMNSVPTDVVSRVRRAGFTPLMTLSSEGGAALAEAMEVWQGGSSHQETNAGHWNRPVE